MTDGSESEGHHVGTRWGNKCPQCDHVESRDYGPGRYPSADRCPECDWPMNCVDLDVVDQDPKRELVTDGGRDTAEAEADRTMTTDDCRYCDGTTEARTVDYYGNTVWACQNCEALL